MIHTNIRLWLAAAATVIFTAACTTTNVASESGETLSTAKGPDGAISPRAWELADQYVFAAGNFYLDVKTQEGTTGRERMAQDELQKTCSVTGNKPSAQQSAKIVADARASIVYPEGGIKLGDWKKGREMSWSGFGYRLGRNYDDHTKRSVGATCYNCHELATDRQGGTIGPSLTGYGKKFADTPVRDIMIKRAYDIVYNSHSNFPCTNMPRFGANKVLTPDEIQHVLAYLFDPASPVNK
jgi:L-cysteine S-thiosulfotransferase